MSLTAAVNAGVKLTPRPAPAAQASLKLAPASSKCHASMRNSGTSAGTALHSYGRTSIALSTSNRRPASSRRTSPCATASTVLVDTTAASDAVSHTLRFMRALIAFSRPHTIIGTALGVSSVSLLAVAAADELTVNFVWGVMQAVVPALLMNVFIVGLNQLTDVDIDKVNKPYLPLASGELTMAQGQTIVVGTCAAALVLGNLAGSPPLMWALFTSVALGFVYSAKLPGMRWKRSPVLAAGCITIIRAFVVQFCFYLHAAVYVLHKEPVIPLTLFFVTAMMSIFSVVIAFFKDIPDVKGDRMSSINTLSVRFGERTILNLCIGLLSAAYAGAIFFGAASGSMCGYVLMAAHAVLALYMLQSLSNCDTSDPTAIYAAYMRLWQLFYFEYALIPLFGR